MSRFLNKKYENLKAYTPGEQPREMEYIKLNTNESPFQPSPLVNKAVNSKEISMLQLYPDPQCSELCEKIAELYRVKRENVFTANGSDDILNFAFMAFCGGGKKAVFPEISYGFYKVFSDLHNIEYTAVPMREDFSICYKDYCNDKGFIVIANPNAPTGIALFVSEIEEIVKSNPQNVVLIDEAYVDFGAESCYPLINKYDNLLVVNTFSKSRSMAGARLGFALGQRELIDDLNKLKYSTNPYNVNRLTLAAGVAAILDNDYYMDNCKEIIKTREYVSDKLKEMGFDVLPSKANFLFAKNKKIPGELLYSELKKRGVLVRHFGNEAIKDYIRISIGSKEDMDVLLETTKKILEMGDIYENQ